MKKEIEALLMKESGELAINPYCVLQRKTKNEIGGECDLLWVEFFGGHRHSVKTYRIKARDWRGILQAIADVQTDFYRYQADLFNAELMRGKLFDKYDAKGKWEWENSPMVKSWKEG